MIGALGADDPREVGRYRVLAELGRGGMGRVLLGAGPDGRLVAVKLVRAQLVEDEDFRSRFRREVAASRKVSGAYTAAVVDADAHAPTPWLASVFVPGPSLSDVVTKTGPLPEEPVLRLAAGLAAALVDVHGAELVHRDLKPSNVLLAADGPRVIDFGIARAADSEGGGEITHTGWLIGSPGFMSPEQAEGRALSAASDVFSLGCVLFFACTGRGPFAGPSTPQTLYNVVHAEPDLAAVPEGVRGFVARCLAKEPGARPAPGVLLAELAGRVGAVARPWPGAVHELIDRQQAEVAALLEPADGATFVFPRDPGTVAVTRRWAGTWSGGPGSGVAKPSNLWVAASIAVAALVVVVSLVVWASWPRAGSEDDDAGGSSTTSSEDTYAYDGDDSTYTSDETTTEETYTEETTTTEVTTETTTEADDPVYYAEPGECVWADDPDQDWEIVPCDDYLFEVLNVLRGPTDPEDCGNDVRVRMSIDYGDSRVCLTFRYGNDGGFARMNDCLVLAGTGDESDPVFADCDNATHYVSGYDPDTFDPSFCGADAWHGWEDNGSWGEYLNYTICLRHR